MAIWLKKKKRMLIVCLIVLVIVITGIVIIVSNKVNSGEQKIVETTSKQAEVKEETISTTLTALGEVKAVNNVCGRRGICRKRWKYFAIYKWKIFSSTL